MDSSGVQTLGERNPPARSDQGVNGNRISPGGTNTGVATPLQPNDLTTALGALTSTTGGNRRNTTNYPFGNLFPNAQPSTSNNRTSQWPSLPTAVPPAVPLPAPVPPVSAPPVVPPFVPSVASPIPLTTQQVAARPLSPRDATEIVIDGQLFDPTVLASIPVFADPDPTPDHTPDPTPDEPRYSPTVSPQTPHVIASPQARPQTPHVVASPRPQTPVQRPQTPHVATSPEPRPQTPHVVASPQVRPQTPVQPRHHTPERVVNSPLPVILDPMERSVRTPILRPQTPAQSVTSPQVMSPQVRHQTPATPQLRPQTPATPQLRPQTPAQPSVTSPISSVNQPLRSHEMASIRSPRDAVVSSESVQYVASVVSPIVMATQMPPLRPQTPAQPQQRTPTYVTSGRGSALNAMRTNTPMGDQGLRSAGRHGGEPGSPEILPMSPITIPFTPLRDNPPVIPLPFTPSHVSPGPSFPDRSMMQVSGRPTPSGRPQSLRFDTGQEQEPSPQQEQAPGTPTPARTGESATGQVNNSPVTAQQAAATRSLAERYAAMTAEERARARADFRVKMGILRTAYPRFNIPDFSEDTPLEEIHAQYERYVRQIYIDGNVDQYKGYLIILWLIIEVMCVRLLGLDLGGFTTSQMSIMNRYDRLLIELGEKDQGPTASTWPVEARIVILSLFNAFLFLIVKVVGSYLGNGMARMAQNFITGLLSGNNTQDLINDLNRAQANAEGNNTNAVTTSAPVTGNNTMGGGFDLTSIISTVASVVTGGLNNGNSGGGTNTGSHGAAPTRPRAARRPLHTE